MQLISQGMEAAVYWRETVLWVASGPIHHVEATTIGWKLCWERLGPPHFPEVYSIETYNEWPCVTMEYVEGDSLQTWNEEQSKAVLGELKAANVFHRDIRPPNIIVRSTGEWCLIDFGWACDYSNVYKANRALGGNYRSPSGPDDGFAMDRIRQVLTGATGAKNG